MDRSENNRDSNILFTERAPWTITEPICGSLSRGSVSAVESYCDKAVSQFTAVWVSFRNHLHLIARVFAHKRHGLSCIVSRWEYHLKASRHVHKSFASPNFRTDVGTSEGIDDAVKLHPKSAIAARIVALFKFWETLADDASDWLSLVERLRLERFLLLLSGLSAWTYVPATALDRWRRI